MQTIKCSVGSCMYNEHSKNLCALKDIQVCPCKDCMTGAPETETCCASYKKAK